MGSHTSEYLNCFSALTDKIPPWITRLSELAAHTAAKQEEFRSDYFKYSGREKRSRRRRKNSSLHTNRDDEEVSAAKRERRSDSSASSLDPLTRMKMLKPMFSERNTRKRPSAEAHADDTSDEYSEQVSPPRSQLLIHYDCETQSMLEKLVREIGSVRNIVRKGRMNYMVRSNFGLKSIPSPLPSPLPSSFSDGEDCIKPAFRTTRRFAMSTNASNSPFDIVDTYLETAQTLCEMAAHQFLRSGDCSREIEKTREKLNLALEMAKGEAAQLSEEERIEREAKAKAKAKAKAEAEAEAKAKQEAMQREAANLAAEQKGKDSGKDMNYPINAIEVDDASDSSSSVSVDISAFRSTRLRRC